MPQAWIRMFFGSLVALDPLAVLAVLQKLNGQGLVLGLCAGGERGGCSGTQ
jgi:hypothetical protein